ncbi:MAG: NAD(+)/NADH kinase [Arachnia sp.]
MDRVIGLLINPIAGIGGPAGLKGSDGAAVQAAALTRGATARAQERAVRALRVLAHEHPGTTILTAAGAMGADAVAEAGLVARVVHTPEAPTRGCDSTRAAAALVESGAGLLLFVGGDGTARDVAAAVAGTGVPILGVPAGVKMYSGCFAVSPAAAGALAARWISDTALPLAEREVLDVDEQQLREGPVDPTLYALVTVPFVVGRTQSRKSATAASEAGAVGAAARGVVEAMDPETLYILGPGGTCREIARQLAVENTPLGVDVVLGGHLVRLDASERELLALLEGHAGTAKAIVTVIGGQGFLLGRGNQQISAGVLRALGPNPLLVVATEDKITALTGQPLLVDTGDGELDRSLAGYIRVTTGVQSALVYRVAAC